MVIAIDDGEVLDGDLPKAKMKLVQAWLEIHREDLMADLARLSGPIGMTLGYPYPQTLLSERHLAFDYAPSDDQNMIKVGRGRTAAFVVEEVSGQAALKNTKQEAVIQYDPQSPLFTGDVFFALRKKGSLAPVRDAMKADGSLRKILGNLQPPGKSSSPLGGGPACQ